MTSAPATTPTADHTLTDADSRRVGWAEWGDPQGQPVLFVDRNPGSRLLDPDSGATASAGARLITIDRPGYGRTDPLADPTRSAVAADVAALVRHIGLDDVALMGWSGGACSRSRRPQRSARASARCRWSAHLRPTMRSPGCQTRFEVSRRRSRQTLIGHSHRSPRHAASMPRFPGPPSSRTPAPRMRRFVPDQGSLTPSVR